MCVHNDRSIERRRRRSRPDAYTRVLPKRVLRVGLDRVCVYDGKHTLGMNEKFAVTVLVLSPKTPSEMKTINDLSRHAIFFPRDFIRRKSNPSRLGFMFIFVSWVIIKIKKNK